MCNPVDFRVRAVWFRLVIAMIAIVCLSVATMAYVFDYEYSRYFAASYLTVIALTITSMLFVIKRLKSELVEISRDQARFQRINR